MLFVENILLYSLLVLILLAITVNTLVLITAYKKDDKPIPKREEKKVQKAVIKQNAYYDNIMQNIENYNGTGEGQKEVKE
jgi:hypothetical protein